MQTTKNRWCGADGFGGDFRRHRNRALLLRALQGGDHPTGHAHAGHGHLGRLRCGTFRICSKLCFDSRSSKHVQTSIMHGLRFVQVLGKLIQNVLQLCFSH